jgi:ribosomal protein S18 acetylase RimI-like enzyme
MPLRALQPADAPAYRTLRLRGLREHPDAFTSSFEEESVRPLADSESRLAATSSTRMWGAFEGGKLAGVFGWSRELRLKSRHKAVLVGMYVAPEFAGRGIGRELVRAVLTDAQQAGIELAVLTVTAGNERARSLYTQAGFQSFGIEPDAIRVAGARFGKEHLFLQLPRARPGADS